MGIIGKFGYLVFWSIPIIKMPCIIIDSMLINLLASDARNMQYQNKIDKLYMINTILSIVLAGFWFIWIISAFLREMIENPANQSQTQQQILTTTQTQTDKKQKEKNIILMIVISIIGAFMIIETVFVILFTKYKKFQRKINKRILVAHLFFEIFYIVMVLSLFLADWWQKRSRN